MSIEETYKTIDTIIASIKKARRNNDYLTIMTSGLALLEYIPNLVIYMTEQEGEYRKFESGLIDGKDDTGKSRTSSYSETKAKATAFYREWQKAKYFLELIYELVNMSKALGRGINSEFNAT